MRAAGGASAAATIVAMQLDPVHLAELCGGRVEGGATADPGGLREPLAAITTDSREVVAGGAFVAVRGERMDGHAFVADAAARGAAAAVVDAAWAAPEGTGTPPLLVRVADTGLALRRACAARLRELGCEVVGVTGSVGKTTAKEMIADVLGPGAARTPGNLNTWTGVPLSVLRLDPPVDVLVAEMGMSAPGEIADLAAMTGPRIGVLLNVGVSHIELLGSREAIAEAKAELLAALPERGLAVCNADDPRVRQVAHRGPAPVRWFGLREDAEVRARDIVADGLRGTDFTLVTPAGTARVRLRLPGVHLVTTACAAAAVAEERGVAVADLVERLHGLAPVAQRGAVLRGARGATIYDDSYNSAPQSLAAALGVLRGSGSSERIAVLGDMLELGAESDAAHDLAGRGAAEAATLLIAVGEQAERMVVAAVAAGLPPERALVAADADAAAGLALAACSPAATVLVKASHGLHLETVVERLRA